ncbi:MAG: CHASE3 domain-containing protein [Aliidongia sp.]
MLLAVAIVAYRTTDALIENDGLVNRTYEARLAMANLLSLLKDAETGQRGFVLTGDETYLAPYSDALPAIKNALDSAKALTADNPAEQQRVLSLAPLIDSKLTELRQTIDLRRSTGFRRGAGGGQEQ